MRVYKARAVQRNNDAKSKQRERFDFGFTDTLNCVFFSLVFLQHLFSLSLSLSLFCVKYLLRLNSLLFFFVETRRSGIGIAEVFIVFAERIGCDFTDVPRGERG